MKWLALVLCMGVLSWRCLTFAQNHSPGQKATPAKSDAQTPFDALKSLAGTWTGAVTTDPPNPEINGPIRVTMRVASRGNVLVHEIPPGGVPEPTMIYLDGDRLTLVHYCEAGNRPRLVARMSPDQKTVEFDFVDISGGTNPAYLHHFVFTIISADHHTEAMLSSFSQPSIRANTGAGSYGTCWSCLAARRASSSPIYWRMGL